jgi:hypothetical protein
LFSSIDCVLDPKLFLENFHSRGVRFEEDNVRTRHFRELNHRQTDRPGTNNEDVLPLSYRSS